MFGLFRQKEIASRWRFHGKPDKPGALVYSREGGQVEGLVGPWMLGLAVSKTLFTVGEADLTSATCLLLMDYSQMLRKTDEPDFNPFDLSLFTNHPSPIDAERSYAERIPLHRAYVYEFIATQGGNMPRLETSWPREYSPADVLSMFRLMASENLAMSQGSLGPHMARGMYVLLFEQIAAYYAIDERLHTKPSSIIDVPSMAMQHIVQTLEQVMSNQD